MTSAAIIGLGPHGTRLLAALKGLRQVEIDAVVDIRDDALANAAVPAGCRRLRSAGELWKGIPPELVCVATNGPSHADLTLKALECGVKRIFVEKPMGCSVAECDRMIEAATQRGARLAVDQGRRHDPFYRWLRDQIVSGLWGEPRAIWIQRPGVGLGCLATHSFDLAVFLTSRLPVAVAGWVDPARARNPRGDDFVDPGGTVVMDMGAGLKAIVVQVEDGAGPMSVEVDLTGARVRVDEKSGVVDIVERDLSIVPGPDRPSVFRQVEPPDGLTARTDMAVMIRGGLLELLGEGPMDCAAEYGRLSVEVLVAAHCSDSRGHGPVALPLSSRGDRERWLPVT